MILFQEYTIPVFRLLLIISIIGGISGQYVALILARGGSKQIPKKNLAIIENKSLLKRTIEVAKSANVFNTIWVSTDNLEIYAEAVSAGANVFGRSEETATDVASSFAAVQEFYHFFPNFTGIALLQCTSPFHSSVYLRKAHLMMSQLGYDSIFSVSQNYKLLWRKDEEFMVPLNFDTKFRPRRQDMKWQYVENGMFYWIRPNLIEDGILQGGRIGIVDIPLQRSLEIDTFDDLEYARQIAPTIFPSIKWDEQSCSAEEYSLQNE